MDPEGAGGAVRTSEVNDGGEGRGLRNALEAMRSQALDLSFRNRLLDAKEGKLLIGVEGECAGAVEDALAAGKKVDVRGRTQEGEPGRKRPAVRLEVDPALVNARMVEIYRRAKSRFEETGLETAYLGLGTLSWVEKGIGSTGEGSDGKRRCAPILLQPVKVQRKQAAGPYWLESLGQASANTTLLEWLRRTEGVDTGLPDPLPEDESGVDVDNVIREVEHALEAASAGRFEIGWGAMLGIFEFQRLALWSELGRMVEAGTGALGDLAKEMLGHETEGGYGPTSPVDARKLERTQGRKALPVPLEADASQIEAVAKAQDGRSFVLQGPPGTGKSQTIANIIATVMARGETVLFCAEKRAAIDAVASRLQAVGLGRWCLDLHDGREAAQAVRDVAEAVEAGYEKSREEEGDEPGEDPTEHRDALNRVGEALHKERGWGVGVYGAMGRAGKPGGRIEQAIPPAEKYAPKGVEGRLEAIREYVLGRAAIEENEAKFLDAVRTEDEDAGETLPGYAQAVLECQQVVEDVARRWRKSAQASWIVRWWTRRSLRTEQAAAQAGLRRAHETLAIGACRTETLEPGVVALLAQAPKGLKRQAQCNRVRNGEGYWWEAVAGDAEAAANALREGKRRALNALLDGVERGWWKAWADRWITDEPLLGEFNPIAHDEHAHLFREREDRWMAGEGAKEVERRCSGRTRLPDLQKRTREEKAARDQVKLVVREGKKKRRVAPIRKILGEAGETVRRVKPCLMMSPLAAARSLPPDMKFDLVVMDEASQIRPGDALGVLSRAGRVVLAGDPKQMPPTTFFERGGDEEDDGDEDAGIESVLEMALAKRMPVHALEVHYRSRHERLIDFSNRRYYGGSLVTFPDAHVDAEAVSLQRVEGVYEAQRNVREAQAVAQYVAEHVKGGEGDLSIGVVTFNRKQQRLVEDLLDRARAEDPEVEAAWHREGRPEPCVRNLETAQGDERDVVVLSTTYGPDAQGRQRSMFGPLNREGGERRLNVAVTRSKERMVVFTSLRTEEVGTPQSPQGVRDLRAFLEYAEHGGTVQAPEAEGSVGGYESPLEEQIAARLEGLGWTLVPQVGMAGYRIDMGVVHPDRPGRYLAGIEADGAQYHGARTARDRDRLRQRVLEDRGWRLLRVWSPDWWQDPERCTRSLDKKLRALREGGEGEFTGHDA